jgi:hypothetical protein
MICVTAFTTVFSVQCSGVGCQAKEARSREAGKLESLNARRLGSWELGVGWVERGLG